MAIDADSTGGVALAFLVAGGLLVGVPLKRADAQSDGTGAESSEQSSGSESAAEGGAAAPPDEDATRGRVLEIRDENLQATVRRPEGWVNTDTNSSAAAAFQAASDKRAQIEVRYSTPIRKGKRDSYFNSFHSELKSAGFVRKGTPTEKTYGSKTGRETEYEGDTGDATYRLIVWEFYNGQTAWIIAGFFDAERRDRHYGAFQATAESLSTERTDEE